MWGAKPPICKKGVVRQLSYKNFLAKFLYDNIFHKFLSQAMAFNFPMKYFREDTKFGNEVGVEFDAEIKAELALQGQYMRCWQQQSSRR